MVDPVAVPVAAGVEPMPLGESASAGPEPSAPTEPGAAPADSPSVAVPPSRQPHPRYAGRDVRGRLLPENTAALVHGGRRPQPSAVQASLRAATRARVLSDLGATEDDVPVTLSGLVDRLAETSLLCEAYMTWLSEQGGPIGTRGRQKAAVRGYLAALDRQMRLAQLIGLERRPKRAQSLADVLAEGDPLLHGDAAGDGS